ncbi:MAG: thioredoxin [Bacteroidales bacterium]|jgi:thioredoxin|nr:thioredoxin [Bacteroidales bacterium]MBQ5856480.1 thioredoxin [Bacteroidales bacterium]
MKAINITKEEFLKKVMDYESNPTEWKYKGDKPAIIDFYASWCGPCKMLAPVLDELAKEYDGKVYIYKVDTEVEEELSQVFGIRSIPTMLFVPMEGKPMMTQGALPKSEIEKMIKQRLLN